MPSFPHSSFPLKELQPLWQPSCLHACVCVCEEWDPHYRHFTLWLLFIYLFFYHSLFVFLNKHFSKHSYIFLSESVRSMSTIHPLIFFSPVPLFFFLFLLFLYLVHGASLSSLSPIPTRVSHICIFIPLLAVFHRGASAERDLIKPFSSVFLSPCPLSPPPLLHLSISSPPLSQQNEANQGINSM